MGGYFGLIELLFFYGIAIGIAYWQWAKMRRELRESRERKEAEARAKDAGEAPAATSLEASDREA